MPYNLRDAGVKKTIALPAGALTVNTAGIDLEQTARGEMLAGMEVAMGGPALTVAQLPNGETITYSIEMDSDSAFGTPTAIGGSTVQTGAGGAGSAAVAHRAKLPNNCERYIRGKAVKTGAASAATANGTLELLF